MIVVAGDSWGCGEWQHRIVQHGGLAQYLAEDNYNVVNLSVGGSSNWDIYDRLKLFFDSNTPHYLIEKIQTILVFQTEWPRDIESFHPNKVESLVGTDLISSWQFRLSELATEQQVRIGLIGGCSDTMYLDNFEKEYPGLYIACQSFTNLCVNNNHRIENPTYFCRPDDSLLPSLKDLYLKQHGTQDLLLADLENGISRLKTWEDNCDYFYPDGMHANRKGHKILYEFLQAQKFI